MRFAAALTLISALLLPVSGASATTITFDDIAPQINPPNGYGGMNWSSFTTEASSVFTNPVFQQPNGYVTGNVSAPNMAYSLANGPASFTSANPFTLNSLYVASAWRDDLNLAITGRLNGVDVIGATAVLQVTGPTLLTLNWTNIDEVVFLSSGGVDHNPNLPGFNNQVVFDDITINAGVPEPATWAMILLGFAGVGFMGARSSRRRVAA